ncbi:NCS2 family permease [Actinospica sp.]|jgi:AGZA family xanthine/uracil permease-like MFS transporter|uniref:NCS2 family permease n=1 Tax=Actinospica sp. TaxID=1872142 RepID=UPI002C7846F3|nr:NCS2 family permease [Actinospica sp.]HWG27929.1 NCS2 family permease [Actinospica sp.]
MASALDSVFGLHERGSSVLREVRGGVATFFALAYIVVLNPLILGSGKDLYGHTLGTAQLTVATAVVAGVMTILMGLGGNLPLAVAAGLGLNGVVAYTIAPTMSWPDAMGLVVLEGIGICLLVVTGLRKMIMDAIPMPLKRAIGVGIGLFIALIGLVDAGFVTRVPDAAQTAVPVQLGANGELDGWPVLIFCLGLLGTFLLLVRRVPGAILISIVGCTVVAVIVNRAAHLTRADWGLIQPKVPHHLFASPDFHLLGRFSLFGGFVHAGVVTAVVFIFTLILSDFFDAMGTIVGVTGEAGLLTAEGEVPGINRVLFIDGLAAAAGGAGSCSSNTTFVESAAGVGEGARTGLASVVTGGLLLLTAFVTPLTGIVPQQAAAPALVVVGFLMITQIQQIPWDDWSIAIPGYLAIALMPFTYSITDGIGAAVIAFVAIRLVLGRLREVHWLMVLVALLFVAYFALSPIEQWLGVR